MAHDHHHHDEHAAGEEGEGTYGMAFGFRTVAQGDQLYLVEVEIAPYVDEPSELGATLVFHALEWVDPSSDVDVEVSAWTIDIDPDLVRKGSDPIPTQFDSIGRQLHAFTEEQLLEYLEAAQEE